MLLSSVACAAWCVSLPTFGDNNERVKHFRNSTKRYHGSGNIFVSVLIIISLICGSIWFETMSGQCNQSMKHIWSVLLHNRWNVFVGAEEYVTWEIAPGKLADGSVVDVWGRKDYVDWAMPGKIKIYTTNGYCSK